MRGGGRPRLHPDPADQIGHGQKAQLGLHLFQKIVGAHLLFDAREGGELHCVIRAFDGIERVLIFHLDREHLEERLEIRRDHRALLRGVPGGRGGGAVGSVGVVG
jgi:hypothetical protein